MTEEEKYLLTRAVHDHYDVIPAVRVSPKRLGSKYIFEVKLTPKGEKEAQMFVAFLDEETRDMYVKQYIEDTIEFIQPDVLVRHMSVEMTIEEITEMQALPNAHEIITKLIKSFDEVLADVLATNGASHILSEEIRLIGLGYVQYFMYHVK
jgi:hypothetical protein